MRTGMGLIWLLLIVVLPRTLCASEVNPDCDVSDAAFWAGWPDKTFAALIVAGQFAESGSPESIDGVMQQFRPDDGRTRAAFLILLGNAYFKESAQPSDTQKKYLFTTQTNFRKAVHAYKAALKEPGLPEVLRRTAIINLARIEQVAGNKAEVIGLLEPLTQDTCGNLPARALFWLADSYAEQGRNTKALQYVDRAVREKPDAPVDWLELDMQLRCSAGQLKLCADQLVKIARHPHANPDNSVWLSQFAQKLSTKPDAAPVLAIAQDEGFFDKNWQVQLRPMQVVVDPTPTRRVAPEYPAAAISNRFGGFVKMKILIGGDGAVKDAKVIWALPAGYFEEVCLVAVRQWRFEPKKIDQQAAQYEGEIKFTFTAGP